MTPRGIRNNNPGNIRHGDKWRGLADKQTDASFCVFKAPEWGIRALVKILRNYQTKHGLKTVESIINRFAPQIENDTSSYILSVCQVLDVKPRDVIDVFEPGIMINLLKAVIRHENGIQPYSDEVLKKSLELADK
jgi:hypothetical protein